MKGVREAIGVLHDGPLPRFGRYETLAELAYGGTGAVYLARLHGVGGFERLFAIKTLHKHLAARPHVVDMVIKEARITAQIQHPHVVDTIELGATDGGEPFLVMAYVEGVSLDDLLVHPTLDAIGRLRLGIPILLDAMLGVDAAHRAHDATTGEPLNVVHRDISPANVLIGMDGLGRIADFGIASARMQGSGAQSELVRGTPRYMAPEQTKGGPLDRRADVFALGAVLWEVITGEPLFDSRISVEHILGQVLTATIPPPSDRNSRISAALDAVCLRALQRDVDARFQTVAELRDALARAAEADGFIASRGELIEQLDRLFGDRIERRRELVRRAAGRKSGTRLRALSETQVGLAPAPDLSSESVVRPIPQRSSVDATQIGMQPLRPITDFERTLTLDELMARDGTADDDEPQETPAAYALPLKHWRRWAALAALVIAAAIAWLALRGSHARPSVPPQVAPAANALPAARGSAPTMIDVVDEPVTAAPIEQPAKRTRVWKPLPAPARPRPVAQALSAIDPLAEPDLVDNEEAAASAPALELPLEPNPYLLER